MGFILWWFLWSIHWLFHPKMSRFCGYLIIVFVWSSFVLIHSNMISFSSNDLYFRYNVGVVYVWFFISLMVFFSYLLFAEIQSTNNYFICSMHCYTNPIWCYFRKTKDTNILSEPTRFSRRSRLFLTYRCICVSYKDLSLLYSIHLCRYWDHVWCWQHSLEQSYHIVWN